MKTQMKTCALYQQKPVEIALLIIMFAVTSITIAHSQCDPNRYLFEIETGKNNESEGAHCVSYTADCGFTVGGDLIPSSPSGGTIVRFRQDASLLWSMKYGKEKCGSFKAIMEVRENGTDFIIAVGDRPQASDFYMAKINSITGALVWDCLFGLQLQSTLSGDFEVTDLAYDGSNYIAVGNIGAPDNQFFMVSVQPNGIPLFSNVWISNAGHHAAEARGVTVFNNEIYVTGWVELTSTSTTRKDVMLLRFNPAFPGNLIGQQRFRFWRGHADYNTYGYDLWVGDDFGSGTEIVIVGKMETNGLTKEHWGGFALRFDPGNQQWFTRRMLGTGGTPENRSIIPHRIDRTVQTSPGWIVAGISNYFQNGSAAFLLHFDRGWAVQSNTYGRAGFSERSFSAFNDVVTRPFPDGISNTLDHGYLAVGTIKEQLFNTATNQYYVKPNIDLSAPADCQETAGPGFEEWDVEELGDFGFSISDGFIYDYRNTSATYESPQTLCAETIMFQKQGAGDDRRDIVSHEAGSSASPFNISQPVISREQGFHLNCRSKTDLEVSIAVFDLLGNKKIVHASLIANSATPVFIDTRACNPGLHLVNLAYGGRSESIKLLIRN